MAFMMPVMKNNYDIYKDTRSRKNSECSTSSSGPDGPSSFSAGISIPGSGGRARKVSECKSESFSAAPTVASYRMQMQRCHSSRAFPRSASRGGTFSPPRSSFSQQTAGSPPKRTNSQTESQTDISKFHLRLVDKLRKSFGKDTAKRS